jgi:hypothetical protein
MHVNPTPLARDTCSGRTTLGPLRIGDARRSARESQLVTIPAQAVGLCEGEWQQGLRRQPTGKADVRIAPGSSSFEFPSSIQSPMALLAASLMMGQGACFVRARPGRRPLQRLRLPSNTQENGARRLHRRPRHGRVARLLPAG